MMFWHLVVISLICVAGIGFVNGFAPAQVYYEDVQGNPASIVLENGFVKATFNLTNPQIDYLAADFLGNANYGANLLVSTPDPITGLYRQGIMLERDQMERHDIIFETLVTYASSSGACIDFSYEIRANSSDSVVVFLSGVCDDPKTPVLSSNWTITLNSGDRFFDVSVTAYSVTSETATLKSGRVSLYLNTWATYGLYQNAGIESMLGSGSLGFPYFASSNNLAWFYSLALNVSNGGSNGTGCVDIMLNGALQNMSNGVQTVMLSGDTETQFFSEYFFNSGIQLAFLGEYSKLDSWSYEGWKDGEDVKVDGSESWTFSFLLGANSFDFPVLNTTFSNDSNLDYIQATYTAVYASTLGCIASSYFSGAIAVTLPSPIRAYFGLFTFFDPDSYFTVSSLLYSGNPYLFAETKKPIELTESAMISTGQVPHHFIMDQYHPTYVAISGATQTGPNVFWALSALKIARETGDFEWLEERMPAIEQGITYLLNIINPDYNLIFVPGSLFIDVFIRDNFTSDSNAAVPYLLYEAAKAEDFFNNTEMASYYRDIAGKIIEAYNIYLWNTTTDDHFITQRDLDGNTRDFVDYDSNLMSIAFQIANPDRYMKILQRIDSGNCTHARATYVSQYYYNTTDCFSENTGDSAVTMGRIGWLDGLARKVTNDSELYYSLILNPLLHGVLNYTWLWERFTCQATPTHNPFYHEYPETVAMLIREVTYGIAIDFTTFTIDPMLPSGNTSFHYHVGEIDIYYSPDEVAVAVPYVAMHEKAWTITQLNTNAVYNITTYQNGIELTTQQNATSDSGTLNFNAVIGPQVSNVIVFDK